MNESKVAYEVAEKEVNEWVASKKTSDKKLAALKEPIEVLIDGVQSGLVTIGEDRVITQRLRFPVLDTSGNEALSELKFKPRITVAAVNEKMKAAQQMDTTGTARLLATAAALTDRTCGELLKLDTEDNTILQAVALFFL